MDWLTMERWSPYVVGAGIGILSWLSFLLLNKPIGCSTAFTRTAGMIERLFTGDRVREKPYYQQFAPQIDWEWMLVLGVIIGAFVSSNLSGTFGPRWVPERWAEAFGDVPLPRLIVALIGGILMGFGARWANGCTSGHGISGSLQLAVSGWVAAVCFFAGGIATAMLIYRVLAG
jgi:uncharacterized membrane protein YedE/YeeE